MWNISTWLFSEILTYVLKSNWNQKLSLQQKYWIQDMKVTCETFVKLHTLRQQWNVLEAKYS